MEILFIYDVLVYHFKKDIAKLIYSFIHDYYDQFEYEGKKIIDNKLYYCFSYSETSTHYVYINNDNGELICDEWNFESQKFDNYISYRDYDRDILIGIEAYKYKDYVEDIIERESKNDKN